MKTFSTQSGFTLIEAIVSTGLIITAIIGPLSVAVNSSSYARDTRNQVISSYLAQESVELLRFYRDTIFLRCVNGTSSCTAQDLGSGNYEQSYEAAWRLFKTGLSGGGGNASCFAASNPLGCTYDIYSFLQSPGSNPTLYLPSAAGCAYLARDDRKQNSATSSVTYPTDGMYLCAGNANGFTPTTFTRVVKITSLPVVPATGADTYDTNYNDDLRVEVVVKYNRSNGFSKQIKVVDFIRARI
jgi:type II secretory pathway pseudopilin PulG